MTDDRLDAEVRALMHEAFGTDDNDNLDVHQAWKRGRRRTHQRLAASGAGAAVILSGVIALSVGLDPGHPGEKPSRPRVRLSAQLYETRACPKPPPPSHLAAAPPPRITDDPSATTLAAALAPLLPAEAGLTDSRVVSDCHLVDGTWSSEGGQGVNLTYSPTSTTTDSPWGYSFTVINGTAGEFSVIDPVATYLSGAAATTPVEQGILPDGTRFALYRGTASDSAVQNAVTWDAQAVAADGSRLVEIYGVDTKQPTDPHMTADVLKALLRAAAG